MLALINGGRGLVSLAKGTDNTVKVMVANEDGLAIDITGDSIDLIVYDRSDRLNAALATHAGDALTTPTAGFATVTIPDSEMTYGPGDYYVFVRWTDVSATKVYFSEAFSLNIF